MLNVQLKAVAGCPLGFLARRWLHQSAKHMDTGLLHQLVDVHTLHHFTSEHHLQPSGAITKLAELDTGSYMENRCAERGTDQHRKAIEIQRQIHVLLCLWERKPTSTNLSDPSLELDLLSHKILRILDLDQRILRSIRGFQHNQCLLLARLLLGSRAVLALSGGFGRGQILSSFRAQQSFDLSSDFSTDIITGSPLQLLADLTYQSTRLKVIAFLAQSCLVFLDSSLNSSRYIFRRYHNTNTTSCLKSSDLSGRRSRGES
mmetsp:Transcript_42371/g.106907  ORF Transcript_42371/g.106907 Transcript_42371/m.106907 type:complete len:260 (-) Transcript_42371:409-1188(-)